MRRNRTDHSIDNCENKSKCPNCAGDHIAGSRECWSRTKSRKIKEAQTKEKAGRRRAIQILSGEDESPANNSTKFPTHFSCQINPEQKKKFSPWMIQKCVTQKLGTNHEPSDRKENPNLSLKSTTKPKVKPFFHQKVQHRRCTNSRMHKH